MTSEQEQEKEKEKQGGLVWRMWVLILVVVAALQGGSNEGGTETTTAKSRWKRDPGTDVGRRMWAVALIVHIGVGVWMVILYQSEKYTPGQAIALALLLLGPSALTCVWMSIPWLRSFTDARTTLRNSVAVMWPLVICWSKLPVGTNGTQMLHGPTASGIVLGIAIITPWSGLAKAILEVATRAWQESHFGTIPVPED